MILVALMLVVKHYERLIRWCLDHKLIALSVPVFTILWGLVIWLGWNGTFGFVASFDRIGVDVRTTAFWSRMSHHFPSIGSEFMPSLDEGSFLLMPTSMPHTGVEKNIEYVRLLDQQVESIRKWKWLSANGAELNSALDPANTQMFEQVINYKRNTG